MYAHVEMLTLAGWLRLGSTSENPAGWWWWWGLTSENPVGWWGSSENPAWWWWWGSTSENTAGWCLLRSKSENPTGWYMNTRFSELVYLEKKKMEKDHIHVEGLINISKNRKKIGVTVCSC